MNNKEKRKDTCKNCRFWDQSQVFFNFPSEDKEDCISGECCRYPPVVDPANYHGVCDVHEDGALATFNRPVTNACMWCGEHKIIK